MSLRLKLQEKEIAPILYELTIVLSMSLLSINIIITTIILEYRRDVFQSSIVVYVIQFITRYIFLVSITVYSALSKKTVKY